MSLLLGFADTARGALRDLQAHGSAERLWLARSEPRPNAPGSPPTALFVRGKHDGNWLRLEPIESPVLGLASRGSQLAILLSNGDWLVMTDTSPTSGLPLPDRARMVALGSDAETLWAVGLSGVTATVFTPAPPPATAPASRPSAADTLPEAPATRPDTGATKAPAATGPTMTSRPSRGASAGATTGPSAARMTLYRLGPQEWESQGTLPDEIPAAEGVSVSLAVVGGKPVVAHRLNERLVRVFRRAERDKWEVVGDVSTPTDLQDYRVLEGGQGPVVWTRGVTGPSRLWIAGAGDAEPTERELPGPGRDGQADHAVAFANGALRLLWVEDNKIYDQRLNPATGAPDGDPAPLPLPAVNMQPAFQRWMQVVMMAALIFAMAASVKRRQEMQDNLVDASKLPLAPFSTRLAAGVIDVLPAVAAVWLVPLEPTHPVETGGMIRFVIGCGVYIVLTTLTEVLAGRSLGKMATGLRVVGLDGKPAGVGARLVRNVLRVIDLPVMPLALILFSPLRQRAGDLAAGTLVVANRVAAEAVPTEEAEAVGAGTAATAGGPKDESMPKPE